MVCETSGCGLQRNPLHQDKIQIGHNTRSHMWRAGTRRSGQGAQAGYSTAARQRQIKTHRPANNPLSSEGAGAHLRCRRKSFRATRAHRQAATQFQGEPGAGGRPPPPPALNTQGAPEAGAAMNSSAGAGRVPRHGNSIGTAGRGGVNNSGASLAHTMPRKDEACPHRLQPLCALPSGVRTEGGARRAPGWTSPFVPGRDAGWASRATLAAARPALATSGSGAPTHYPAQLVPLAHTAPCVPPGRKSHRQRHVLSISPAPKA